MSSLPKSSPLSLFGVLRRWYHGCVLRLPVMEFGNLFYRIGFAVEMRGLENRGYTGSVRKGLHAPLAFRSQSCKHAYIRYTQQLQTEHPRLSIFDLLLVGKAWQAGSEWDGPVGTLQTQDRCSSSLPAVRQLGMAHLVRITEWKTGGREFLIPYAELPAQLAQAIAEAKPISSVARSISEAVPEFVPV